VQKNGVVSNVVVSGGNDRFQSMGITGGANWECRVSTRLTRSSSGAVSAANRPGAVVRIWQTFGPSRPQAALHDSSSGWSGQLRSGHSHLASAMLKASAIKWTRLSCRSFAANTVRLQLHALTYNLGNFMGTLAMPKAAEPWSLTSLHEKLIKIGAKVVSHGRYVTFQMAKVAVPRQMFQDVLRLIGRLWAPAAPGCPVARSAGRLAAWAAAHWGQVRGRRMRRRRTAE